MHISFFIMTAPLSNQYNVSLSRDRHFSDCSHLKIDPLSKRKASSTWRNKHWLEKAENTVCAFPKMSWIILLCRSSKYFDLLSKIKEIIGD